MPTTLWADLISLTVGSNGDTVFRGEVDRLRIIFTVDDSDDEDPYIVYVENIIGTGDAAEVFRRGVIDRGVVSANETVNVFWDGTIDGAQLPDGTYTIRVVVDDDEENALTADATLDSSVPRVSGVFANGDPNLLISEGSFIKESLRSITVTGADDGGKLDLGNPRTTVFLRNERQAVVRGTLNYDGADLTFTLINPLDIPSENGKYTLILILLDKAGNVIQSVREFTFDNVEPSLKRVSTNRGGLIPGAGVSQRLNFVEAVLTDNLEDGIDLFASIIRLIGPKENATDATDPDGPTISGKKTEDAENDKIRWSLLTPLLGRDDSQDGEYTIEVVAVDKAGNRAEAVRVPFLYDNLAPRLVSLRPLQSGESFNFVDDTVYYNLPITGFVAEFEDIGIGVDLTSRRQSTHIVFGTPKESGDGLNVRGGRALPDSDNNTLTYVLNKPIVSRDGSQDGRYTLSVRATDTAGNTKTYNYQLIYDTQLPTLVSTMPASNETVSELSQVQVKLDEVTSGIDFVQSSFQLTRDEVDVPVNVTSNGIDTATLALTKPIALDGSDDGTYAIKVTPTDRAGNPGVPVVREFYLVSQKHEPEIRLATPQTTRVNSLMTVGVELVDYVGAGIDFDASTVTVKNAQGILIPQKELEHDEVNNSLTWTTEMSVPPDGSADGEYTIIATFVDFTGKSFTRQFLFVLDTQVPEIESVHVAIESQPELSVDNITTITESFSQIIVTFEDTVEDSEQDSQEPSNDIDFANTVIELTRPGSDGSIPSNVSVYSSTQLAIRFVELIEDGSYTLSITPRDIAGNTARGAMRYAFLLDTESPRITASSPLTLSEPVSYIGGDFRQFVFTIEDVGPADLFFEEQTVELLDASGNTVPAALTYNELTSQLYLTIVSPFAQDGSSDGEYTVKISLVDKAGNRLNSEHTVVYDSKVPQLSSVMLNTEPPIVLEPQLIKMISETVSSITLQFEDATRVDFTNTVVELTRPGPEGPIPIPSNISVDSFTQLTIRFVELMEDGSYTLSITPRDVAGNAAQGAMRYAFLLDTESPHITAPTPLVFNQRPVTYIGNALRQFQFAFTVEDVGPAGLYLEEQTIEVLDASGANIPVAVTHDELTNQLYLALPASLPRDGSADGEYTVKISLVDKAGNRSDSEYTVVYDSKAPQLGSVMVNTNPSMELIPNRIAEIVESINSITLQFEEATYIDFANTQITLMGPESTDASGVSTTPSIPLTLEDDGIFADDHQFLRFGTDRFVYLVCYTARCSWKCRSRCR